MRAWLRSYERRLDWHGVVDVSVQEFGGLLPGVRSLSFDVVQRLGIDGQRCSYMLGGGAATLDVNFLLDVLTGDFLEVLECLEVLCLLVGSCEILLCEIL